MQNKQKFAQAWWDRVQPRQRSCRLRKLAWI